MTNRIISNTKTVNQKRFTVFLCPKVKISYRKSAHKYKKVLNKMLSDETFLIIWRCFFVPLNKCGIKFYPYTNFGANTIGCEKSSCLLLFRARVCSPEDFCFLIRLDKDTEKKIDEKTQIIDQSKNRSRTFLSYVW